MSGITVGNLARSLLTEGTGPGQTYAWAHNEGSAIARWGRGNLFNTGVAAPERCVFQALGPQAATDEFGGDEVANFFDPATGAHPDGGQRVLVNALRWLFNPDAIPDGVAVKPGSPRSRHHPTLSSTNRSRSSSANP